MVGSKKTSQMGWRDDSSKWSINKARPSLYNARRLTVLEWIAVLCCATLLIGVLIRLSSLFNIDGRLFWQFMTEDGYLMQTVARNMALGLGMSTADGTIPTNGVQPLATYIFEFGHMLAAGNRAGGIIAATIISVATSIVAAAAFYFLTRRLLRSMAHGELYALMLTTIWFVGPLPLAHSMNGLETSLYWALLLTSLYYYVSITDQGQRHIAFRDQIILGVLLGTTFLARNDAVFFIASLLLAHLIIGGRDPFTLIKGRLVECLVIGITAVLLSVPWLANNYLLFGTVVPISGLSQSLGAAIGQNLPLIPANLLEAMLPFAPVPRSLEATWILGLFSTAIFVAALYGFWTLWASKTELRQRLFATIVMFTVLLSGYYGLFFGAPHFISRYLSILSPLLWFATAVCVIVLSERFLKDARLHSSAMLAGTIFVLTGSIAVSSVKLSKGGGTAYMHKQVVMYIEQNVPDSVWVGAVQTGTIGYFHDKTLNLDGKVNPAALAALYEEGHVLNYVLKTPIQYIADWHGVAEWVDHKGSVRFSKEFKVVVHDPKRNLAVLRRQQVDQ